MSKSASRKKDAAPARGKAKVAAKKTAPKKTAAKKPAVKKTKAAAGAARKRKAAAPAAPAAPTVEEIRARAHRIWDEGGRGVGNALADWLRAEAELRAERGTV